MKKIIISLCTALSISVSASEIDIKKQFVKCDIIELGENSTLIQCPNTQYVAKYKIDHYGKRMSLISLVQIVDGKTVEILN